uniref:2-aminoethanethiol dioxygenase n=1 Tax=Bos mutus grunniens TaxID=30521 RepID=A0A8C0ALN3_BOSMU
MPRDNMASLIQRIARQACLTFRGSGGGRSSSDRGEAPGPEAPIPQGFPENLSKLKSLLTQVRAEDLNISPRKATVQPLRPNLPPVTYMHICETDGFSLGVFLLKSGTSIPLHDHPGMHGILKVLYGTVRISCMDKLEVGSGQRPRAPPPEQQFEPPLQPGSWTRYSRACCAPGQSTRRPAARASSRRTGTTCTRSTLWTGPPPFWTSWPRPTTPTTAGTATITECWSLSGPRRPPARPVTCPEKCGSWRPRRPMTSGARGSLIQVPRSSLEAAGARKRWAEHLPYSDLGLAGRDPITRAFFLPPAWVLDLLEWAVAASSGVLGSAGD